MNYNMNHNMDDKRIDDIKVINNNYMTNCSTSYLLQIKFLSKMLRKKENFNVE